MTAAMLLICFEMSRPASHRRDCAFFTHMGDPTGTMLRPVSLRLSVAKTTFAFTPPALRASSMPLTIKDRP
jgi:hypothetical protein